MCGDPGRCDDQDVHAGYEGALRCLVDSHGDVAWTKRSAVSKFFKKRTSVSGVNYRMVKISRPLGWCRRSNAVFFFIEIHQLYLNMLLTFFT